MQTEAGVLALSEAILACLADRAMSGYDIAKYFDASIGFFWRASHPQIYRELRVLKDKGFVAAREIAQSGKPNRIEYDITPEGRRAFLEWSRRPAEPPSIKDDMLVRLYALEAVDIDALREQIGNRLAFHRDRLKRYLRIKETRFGAEAPQGAALGKLLGLEIGLKYETGWIEWCEAALIRLAAPAGANVVPLKHPRKGDSR